MAVQSLAVGYLHKALALLRTGSGADTPSIPIPVGPPRQEFQAGRAIRFALDTGGGAALWSRGDLFRASAWPMIRRFPRASILARTGRITVCFRHFETRTRGC